MRTLPLITLHRLSGQQNCTVSTSNRCVPKHRCTSWNSSTTNIVRICVFCQLLKRLGVTVRIRTIPINMRSCKLRIALRATWFLKEVLCQERLWITDCVVGWLQKSAKSGAPTRPIAQRFSRREAVKEKNIYDWNLQVCVFVDKCLLADAVMTTLRKICRPKTFVAVSLIDHLNTQSGF